MRWVSAVSTMSPLEAAVRDVTTAIARELDGTTPDLAVAFVSEQHQGEYERLPALLRGQLAPRLLIGCSAGGVILSACLHGYTSSFGLFRSRA